MLRNLFVSILSLLALGVLLASSAHAQAITTHTFATLPGSPTGGQLAWLTDNSGTATEGSPAAGGAPAGNRDLVAYDATQTRWEFVLRVPATAPEAGLEKFLAANRIDYDNASSGATAEDVQAALDELFASPGGGDLGTTATGSALTITNTGGTPASIPAATTTTWGALTDEDKTKLDGIEAGAAADQNSAEVPFAGVLFAWVETNVRDALDRLRFMITRTDADGNGLYESAFYWDADGDGSGPVVCSAKDTPDPLCKTVGEVVYPDAGDDINCQIHGCGFGKMERTGELRLPRGVLGQFHCWDASNPANNDRATFYGGSSALHNETTDASFSDCPVDSEGSVLTSISLQDWQGTIIGAGSDTRKLETATMSATRRRDRGTYLVNDMGPWHQAALDNVWFGASEHRRGLSFGFHTIVPAPNQHTGSGAADGDSKGWGTLLLDADLEIFQSNVLCIQNSGGTVGSTHSADGWMSALVAGDLLLVPSQSDPDSGSVSTVPIRIKAVTATACGAGNVGLRVDLGGSQFATHAQDRTHPMYASNFDDAVSNRKVIHPRSDFFETRATVRNLTLMPQDPWNEAGGDCAGSGMFRLAGVAPSDDAQADFDCDTQNLVGFWGGGDYALEDVVINNFHFFAIDGGSAGARPTARGVTFVHGQGGPIADTGIGWRFKQTLVDQSAFNPANSVFSMFGAELQVDDFEIRNSSYLSIATFNQTHQFHRWTNIRSLSNAFSTNFLLECGAKWLTFRDIYTSGRGAGTLGGGGFGGSIVLRCDNPANPIEQVMVENVITEPPDDGIGAEQGPPVMFIAEAATGDEGGPIVDDLTPWGGMVGNSFRGVRSIGYGGAIGGESGCLFGAVEMDSDNPADDDGESIVFTTNFFSDSSIQADGRAFCVARTSGGGHSAIESETLTPAWGDPQACGVMEGGATTGYTLCR